MGTYFTSAAKITEAKMVDSHNIQGSWRGRYFYPGTSDPHGFEAVFIDVDGILEGNILDDGALGEAVVGGKFFFPHVKFVKIYQTGGKHAVNYQGMMAEDGKTMSGRWTIAGAASGTWSARRYEDGEDLKFEREEDKELELVGEKKLAVFNIESGQTEAR